MMFVVYDSDGFETNVFERLKACAQGSPLERGRGVSCLCEKNFSGRYGS